MTNSRLVVRLAALATLAVLPLQGCISFGIGFSSPQFKAKRTVKLEREHKPQRGLQVTTVNGAVRVTGDRKQKAVTIEAVLIATGETKAEAKRRVEAAKVHATRNQEGDLVVWAEFPKGGKGNDQASMTILTPGADGVKLKTTNGGITSAGLAGLLDAHTINGAVRIKKHDGDAILHSTNGAMIVEDHGGGVSLKTTNGSVAIKLQSNESGPVQVRTTNGSVKLQVGSGFAGAINLRTSNGSVRLDDPGRQVRSYRIRRNRGVVEFEKDGKASTLRSTNGAITVRVDR